MHWLSCRAVVRGGAAGLMNDLTVASLCQQRGGLGLMRKMRAGSQNPTACSMSKCSRSPADWRAKIKIILSLA